MIVPLPESEESCSSSQKCVDDPLLPEDTPPLEKQNTSMIAECSFSTDEQCVPEVSGRAQTLSSSGAENDLLENESGSVNVITPSAARLRRRELLATLAHQQPKLKMEADIDLATDQDRKDTPEYWFSSKVPHKESSKGKPQRPKTAIESATEGVKNHELSVDAAFRKIQKELQDKIAVKRRIEQAKRKQLYKQDNDIYSGDEEEEEEDDANDSNDEDEVVSDEEEEEPAPEEGASRASFIVDDIGEDESANVDMKPKSVFIDDEAEESDLDDSLDLEDEDDNPKTDKTADVVEKNDEVVEDNKAEKELEANADNTLVTSQLPGLLLPVTASQFVSDTNDETQNVTDMFLDRRPSDDSAPLFSSGSSLTGRLRTTSGTTQFTNADLIGLCSGGFSDQKFVVQPQATLPSDEQMSSMANSSEKRPLIRLPEAQENDDETDFAVKKKRKKFVISDSESDEEEMDIAEKNTAEPVVDLNEDGEEFSEDLFASKTKSVSGMDESTVKGFESDSYVDSDEENEKMEDEEGTTRSRYGDEEVNSSDDELGIYRRLKETVPIGSGNNISEGHKKKYKSDYIEEEASLSGDDVGSDEDVDDAPDEYEEEEGDKEDLPDQETIRGELQKQFLKQQQDEEARRLLYWKNQLLTDGDLHGETDRTFRLKLREEAEVEAGSDLNGENGLAKKDEEDAEDDEIRKNHIEMVKWKIENQIDEHDLEMRYEDSQLLSAGVEVLQRQGSTEPSSSQPSLISGSSRNSLLQHRSSLSLIVNQTGSSSSIISNSKRGLFISKTEEEMRMEKRPGKTELCKEQKKSVFAAVL